MLTFDIETLPTTDAEVIASLAETVKAPGTLKKPESIAAWMEENRESAAAELVAKTSFDGLYGSIACICYQFDDGEVFSVDAKSSGDENTMLEHFYSHVFDMVCTEYHGGIASQNLTVCGHNIAGFDLPFLFKRAAILGVPLRSVPVLPFWCKRYATGSHIDLMQVWGGWNTQQYAKLRPGTITHRDAVGIAGRIISF